jgi:hypothetical protein
MYPVIQLQLFLIFQLVIDYLRLLVMLAINNRLTYTPDHIYAY